MAASLGKPGEAFFCACSPTNFQFPQEQAVICSNPGRLLTMIAHANGLNVFPPFGRGVGHELVAYSSIETPLPVRCTIKFEHSHGLVFACGFKP